MKKKIDDDFIVKWHHIYDKRDEEEYEEIKNLVKEDVRKIGSISKSTFIKLYKWKTRGRSFHNINLKDYEEIYGENIKIVLELPKNKKIYMLYGLPGVGIPVGSTILHFIYPNEFPIIDERTIKVLQQYEYLNKEKSIYKLRDSPEPYNTYRSMILKIQRDCKEMWNLRQIDRALFTFEKIGEK